MEQKPIIPYSRIVGDDGAFDKARKDLADFIADVTKQAEKLKGGLGTIDIKDTKGLEDYAKKIEEIKNKQAEYEAGLKLLAKTEKIYENAQKQVRKAQNDRTKDLVDIEIQLGKYKKRLSELQKTEKLSPGNDKKRAASIVELKLRIKDLTSEYNKNQKEILETGKADKKQMELEKALITVEENRAETLVEVRERMAALRLVVQNTSLTTEDGRKKIKQYNKEINELTDVLSENSDKFIKSKINIGNYKESVKEALDETGLFKTNIKLLDNIIDKLVDSLFDSKEATELNTVALKQSTEQSSVLASINGFLGKVFQVNSKTVSANTEAVEVNTVAVVGETDAIVTNTAATQANTAVTQTNTVATNKNTGAVGKLIANFKKLNIALKGTIILALIALLGSLFAVFRQGRSGVIETEKALQKFAIIGKVIIATLADLGRGLFQIFGALGSQFTSMFAKIERAGLALELLFKKPSAFSKEAKAEVKALEDRIKALDKSIAESAKDQKNGLINGFVQIKNAITSIKSRYADAAAAIKTNNEGIIRAFEIGDQIKQAELALIKLNKLVRGLEIMAEDDTLSLTTQLAATKLLLNARIKLLQKESGIQKLLLEQANAKARVDLQANASSIGARANAIASIKDEAKFARELLQLNVDLSERDGKNPLDDELLTASIEALKNYENSLNEVLIARQENAEKVRKIDRDIFEQNLDLLIDLIDKEKQLSEQQVNSTVLNYERRLAEFDRFRAKFKDNAQKELEEFNQLAIKSAKLLRDQLNDNSLDPKQAKLIREELKKLENLDLNIKFNNDDSFEILNGDIELSIDNIQKLNKELQSLGLAEIPINRFREFVIETTNWVKDTKDLNLELKKVGVTINQLNEENIFDEQQLKNIRQIKLQLQNLQDPKNLNPLRNGYNKQLKLIEKLEKEKNRITQEAEDERLRIRLRSIADLEKILQVQAEQEYEIQKKKHDKNYVLDENGKKEAHKNSEELLNLQKERIGIVTQLETSAADRIAEENKEKTEKLKEQWERFKKDLFGVFDKVLDKFTDIANKQVKATEDRITKQEKVTDEQRQRAAQGLENTLAFEQKQLAKREADAAKARKRAERLEKIKALYTAYQSYASDPENKSGEAITKTLRDFAILEAIQATFGDGGLAADKIPTDGRGITRGRSHRGNGGGIPVLIEGNEGFLSGREVENLGKDNFYAFKEMLGKGKVSPNLFKNQRSDFMGIVQVSDNSKLEKGLEDIKQEIRNKPTENIKIEELVTGFLKITKEFKTPNKTTRTSHIIKKDKF